MVFKREWISSAVLPLPVSERLSRRVWHSRRLPQFFISDVVDEHVVCRIGIEEKKLLLYDDFKCWDKGLFVGRVSADVISKMRTSN